MKLTASRVAAALALGSSAAAAQSTSITELFNLPAHPASLEASIVAVNPDPSALPEDDAKVWTYLVNCPSTPSPENDACRSAGIYPAQAYHTQGSVWGGTVTATGAGAAITTTWSCALGGEGCDTCTVSAICVNTLVSAAATGSSNTTTTMTLGACDVWMGSVAVFITAGMDKLGTYAYNTEAIGQMTSAYASSLSFWSCATTTNPFGKGPTGPATAFATTATKEAQSGGTTSTGSTITAAVPQTTAGQSMTATTTTSKSPAVRPTLPWARFLIASVGLTVSLTTMT